MTDAQKERIAHLEEELVAAHHNVDVWKSKEAAMHVNWQHCKTAAAEDHASFTAHVAQLEAELTAAATRTVFGMSGFEGSTAQDITDADTKYGVKIPAVRTFCADTLVAAPVTDRVVVGSFKTMSPGTKAAAATYDLWAYQHEINGKVKKGEVGLAAWKTDMTTLQGYGVPGLSVILTAYGFVDPSQNMDDYWVPGCALGVDFDGASPKPGTTSPEPYYDYTQALTNVVAFVKKHQITCWFVGEAGANRASDDLSGTVRAWWSSYWAGQYARAGASPVIGWEYAGQAGSEFTTPAEVASWQALFQQ